MTTNGRSLQSPLIEHIRTQTGEMVALPVTNREEWNGPVVLLRLVRLQSRQVDQTALAWPSAALRLAVEAGVCEIGRRKLYPDSLPAQLYGPQGWHMSNDCYRNLSQSNLIHSLNLDSAAAISSPGQSDRPCGFFFIWNSSPCHLLITPLQLPFPTVVQ
jgi:hypothetical protein